MKFVTVGPRKALGPGAEGAQDEAEGFLETVQSSLLLWRRAGSVNSVKPALPGLRVESLASSLCPDVVASTPGSRKHSRQKADRARP